EFHTILNSDEMLGLICQLLDIILSSEFLFFIYAVIKTLTEFWVI
ncbi:26774_t:CDS:1, partial [Dentiscutata erythropus]